MHPVRMFVRNGGELSLAIPKEIIMQLFVIRTLSALASMKSDIVGH